MSIEQQSMEQKNWLRTFAIIWTGQAFSLLGTMIVQFALVWHLTSSTGSGTVLAIATLMAMLPQIVIGPYVGALVDRWNRKLTMIAADSITALTTLGLAYLFLIGRAEVWIIYVVVLIRASGQAFHQPAMSASTPLMVPKEELARVSGINQALYGLMMVAGPLVGALLLGFFPIQAVLLIDIVTAAIAIFCLLFVVIPQPERSEAAQTSAFADMVEGFHFVWSWTGLAVIIGAAMAINFLMNPAFALLPLLVSKHFGGGAPELSWMEAAMGTGMIVGGIILGVWGGFKRRIVTALVGLVGMGVLVMAIGFVPSTLLGVAIALNFGTNLVNPIVNGSFGAIIQATVPADRQGRVFSILIALATLAAPVGLLIGGPVADAFGVQTWFMVSGVACALLGGALFLVPSVVNIEADAQANAHQSGVAVAAGVPDPAPASDAIKN